jgi:short-subunit dehydrogenase
MNVLLVSNDQTCLQVVCDDIRKTKGVQSHCLCVDLMEDGGPGKVYQWVKDNSFGVSILINNVGIGKGGTFTSMTLKDLQHMMLLNNKVTVEMTHYLIPELQKQPRAYTGTKTFIYAFSLAIAQELKTTNVRVSVLCPGPVLTNEDGLSRINAHGKRSKLLMMYPDQVARIAVAAMLRGKQVIVPGALNAFCFKLGSILPLGVKMPILEKLFRVYKTS